MRPPVSTLVQVVQRLLNRRFSLHLDVDGKLGPQTKAAMLHVPGIRVNMRTDRKINACIQWFCTAEGINAGAVDGYWGPQTDAAWRLLAARLDAAGVPGPWRPGDPGVGAAPAGRWPRDVESELRAFYGAPGENQVRVDSPYPLRLDWNPQAKVHSFFCHAKVADSVRSVLDKAHRHYGGRVEELGLNLYAGCLNVRKIRGGTRYSTHSWGIALDFDSTNNRLRWDHTRARFAKPAYDAWWSFWEDEGWVSLGRAKDYDWMHVQAARV